MTRWHTDAPIAPVGRVAAPSSAATVAMFRSDRAATANLRRAQAFYRQKLRIWARNRAASGPFQDPDPADGSAP